MDELTDGLMEGTKIPNQTTIQTRIYQERDGTWTEKDTLRLLLVCQGFNNEILIELKLKVCTSYHPHPLKILCCTVKRPNNLRP